MPQALRVKILHPGCLQQVIETFDGKRDSTKAGLPSLLGDVYIRQ